MTDTNQHPRVALFGLGIMGGGMARRILGAGFPLTVYNRTAARAASLVADGARLAASPREAVAGADVVISMVADDVASRGLWLGDDGALAGAARGAVLVEASTLTVEWVAELSAAAAARGCALLDAPVTGSKPQAATGELTFLVGGPADALAKAQPVLAAMSRAVVHCGPSGSGSLLKLINNFLCGVQAASLAEALALIERAGLDRDAALGVLTNGAPGSGVVKGLSARMAARDYAPNFHLALMAKDLTYAMRAGEGHGVGLTTAVPALAAFQRAVEQGEGDADFSAVIEPMRASTS